MRRRTNKLTISKLIRDADKIPTVPPQRLFTEEEKDFIRGSLLFGNGKLKKNKGAMYPHFKASYNKRKHPMFYTSWIISLLDGIGAEPKEYTEYYSGKVRAIKTPGNGNGAFHLLYFGDEPNTMKRIKKIGEPGPRALAVWFMEQGKYWNGTTLLSLKHINGFQSIRKLLATKFGLQSTVITPKDSSFSYLKVSSLSLFDIIGPHMHPSKILKGMKGYSWKPTEKEE